MCSVEMLEDSLMQGGGDHNTVVVHQDAIVCVERITDWGEVCQGGLLAVCDSIALEGVEGVAERFVSSCFLC